MPLPPLRPISSISAPLVFESKTEEMPIPSTGIRRSRSKRSPCAAVPGDEGGEIRALLVDTRVVTALGSSRNSLMVVAVLVVVPSAVCVVALRWNLPTPGAGNALLTGPRAIDINGPATTGDLIDIGVPTINNLSTSPVRITSVSLVHTSSAVHLQSVTAYSYQQVGHGVISQIGNLPQRCSGDYVPHHVNAALLEPTKIQAGS
jgi:hypothetical protein